MAATVVLDLRRASKASVPRYLMNPEQFFGEVMNSSTYGIAICDRQMRYRTINRALAAMNGFAPEEHLGKSISEILGQASEIVGAAFEQVFSTAQPVVGLTIHAKLPTRKEMGHWLADYYPVQNAKGDVQHICAIVVEMAAHQRLQEVLSSLAARLLQHSSSGNGEAAKLLRLTQRENGHHHRVDSIQLSFREREVTQLIAQGWSNKEIAGALNISPRTVETHRAHIMSKLGVHNVVELVWYAIREGITGMPVHGLVLGMLAL